MAEPSARWPHWYQNEPYHSGRPPLHLNPQQPVSAHSQMFWRPLPPFMRLPHQACQMSPYYPPPPPPPFGWRPPPPPWALFPPPPLNIAPPHAANFVHQDSYTRQTQHRVGRKRPFPCTGEAKESKKTRNAISDANNGLPQGGADSDRNWTTTITSNEAKKLQKEAAQHKLLNGPDSSLSLILMRGLPGSGKSTLAQNLQSTGPNGLIFSTDDYFVLNGGYDPTLLTVAHKWNQDRAEEAMQKGHSPIIIDNTNIKAWEMKPYVKMALDKGYRIFFHEPDTPWKFDPIELAKRNKHGVTHRTIAKMLDHYSVPISIDIVMSSPKPNH